MKNLFNTPLLITATGHNKMLKKLESYDPEHHFTPEPLSVEPSIGEVTAVIPVYGVLCKSPYEEGMISVDLIGQALEELAKDPSVKNILIDFSSPGGETTGIFELGEKIRMVDENIKPVWGWTSDQCDSAGYWLMSQCRGIGMTKSAQVGSVGVYLLTTDLTEQLKAQGIKIEAFSSGIWKMMGHEFRSLTDAEKQYLTEDVQKQHAKFKSVVLSKRNSISLDDLEGLSFEGEIALQKGFCDVLCLSLEEFVGVVNNETTYNNMKVNKVKIEKSPAPSDEKLKELGVSVTPAVQAEAPKAEIKAEAGPLQPGYAEKDMPGVPGVKVGEAEPDGDEAPHKEPDGDEPVAEEAWYCSKCGTKHTFAEEEAEEEEDEKPEDQPVKKMEDNVVPPQPETPKNYTEAQSTRLSVFGYTALPKQKLSKLHEVTNAIIEEASKEMLGNVNPKQ